MPDVETRTLVLVPTLYEARQLLEPEACEGLAREAYAPAWLDSTPVDAALCGFGLAAAGAGAAHAICRYRARLAPEALGRVILAGIAGTYDTRRAPVGSAFAATGARCVGIGAGAGRAHRSAAALGWRQGISVAGRAEVTDEIAFWRPDFAVGDDRADDGALLLSVTSASGSAREAAARLAAHPDALAEDMEAFAVGLAARLAGVPLAVLRGISNPAGDRRHSSWRTGDALRATRTLLVQSVRAAAPPTGAAAAAEAARGSGTLAKGRNQ